jgi:hypothetical protein
LLWIENRRRPKNFQSFSGEAGFRARGYAASHWNHRLKQKFWVQK